MTEELNCKECGQQLGKVRFTSGDCFVCTNWRCRLHGERQHVEPKPKLPILGLYVEGSGTFFRPHHVSRIGSRYKDEASYRRFCRKKNAKRNDNRHKLKDYGFSPSFSKEHESNKRTAIVMNLIEEGLSVENITKMLSGDNGQ